MESLRVILVFVLSLLSAAVGFTHLDFTNKYYNSVLNESKEDNIVISPFSTREVLAQVYLSVMSKAATELKNALLLRGATKLEAQEELRSHNKPTLGGGAIFEVRNKIYVPYECGLEDEKYQQLPREIFSATAENFNPGDVETNINDWIAEGIHDKIRQIVPRCPGNDEANSFEGGCEDIGSEESKNQKYIGLVIVNAAYFKGIWQHPFRIRKRYFHMLDKTGEGIIGNRVQSMELTTELRTTYSSHLDADILMLPYANTTISMVIVLPRKINNLPYVEKNFHVDDLWRILSKRDPVLTKVTLPKFKFELKMDLEEVLKNIGIREVFNLKYYSIYVTKVLQKTIIDVNEKGSEAVADSSDTGELPIVFDVNRPFLFAIADAQQTYFVGRVSRL